MLFGFILTTAGTTGHSKALKLEFQHNSVSEASLKILFTDIQAGR